MKCKNIIKYIENWAPREIAWEKDNVGLQIGSEDREVKNILLCLDINIKVVEEAIKRKCNLVISHHPLLFHPLRKIEVTKDKTSIIIEKLIKNDITLYSAHTNLDFTMDGVSFEIAKIIGLKEINFLINLKSNQIKLVTFVPSEQVELVANKIFSAGGGVIGEYDNCSFRINGKGTFKGSEKSNPFAGKKENYESVEEVRLEILINKWKLSDVIKALKESHPYEEPAFDIYPLENENINYGIGAFGILDNPLTEKEFLGLVSKKLKAKNLRFSNSINKKIEKVAMCGGSGSEYIREAIKIGADAYITGDIKYHNFQDAENEILLIDAGHYETEIHSLNEMQKRLTGLTKNSGIKIFKYSGSTNPVNFFNN